MIFTDSDDIEPGHWVALFFALLAFIISFIIGAIIRGIIYWIHPSFSATDNPTIICTGLSFMMGALLTVAWIKIPGARNESDDECFDKYE